jgi:endo-1,4-beta-xylanase
VHKLYNRALGIATVIMYLGCGSQGSPAAPASGSGATTPPLQVDPLREAARAAGKKVGAAVQSSYLADGRYSSVLGRHFNYLTAEYEMKWATIESAQGVRNFSPGDNIVGYGQANGMQVKGHTLIWHGSVPGWLNSLSPADFRAAFEAHIRAVGEHFRGRLYAWDVVNEAIGDNGTGLRDTIFLQKLGDTYIADAFRLAHQADPQALLFYNDYSGEGLNAKSDRILQLVSGLRTQGVPIDGVGLQMHITAWNPPSESAVASNMRRLAELGLLVNISEMDVRIRDLPGTPQSKLDAQKAVYKSMVGVCVAEPRCDAVTFWGFTDAYSWIDRQYGADDPLLFDEQYAPKPAFYGVFDAFMRR